jgi:hypothetical protein
MVMKCRVLDDRCPYELASGNVAGCPRFEPCVVLDRADGSIVGCAHARCAIAEPAPSGGTERTFYARCLLRTGDVESERAFVVPLD